jgi:tRNA(Arg) A34 adenosine deaminase TadA
MDMLDFAIDLARKVPRKKGEQRVVAVALDKRGRLISIGYNSYVKTHPRQKLFAEACGNPHREYLHAEVSALLRAKGKPVHELVVARVDSQGNPLPSAPCPVCALASKQFGVKHLTYSLLS